MKARLLHAESAAEPELSERNDTTPEQVHGNTAPTVTALAKKSVKIIAEVENSNALFAVEEADARTVKASP